MIRIVRTDPPTTEDSASFTELGRHLKSALECPCMPMGLSVFLTRDDAAWMSHKHPRLGRFLAAGTLGETDGAVKLAKGQRPSHTTWWPSSECDRVLRFALFEELV